MWHLTACKNSGSLAFLNLVKNEMTFYHISELMLATSIQRYDKKNHFIFIQLKNARLTEMLKAVRCHIYDCIKIFKPFLDLSWKIKCLFLRNM